MTPSTPAPIRPRTAFVVSSVRPHLFETPHFSGLGEVPLCKENEPTMPELMRPYEAVDKETLWVDHEEKYLDNMIGCAECRSIYQSRFQQ